VHITSGTLNGLSLIQSHGKLIIHFFRRYKMGKIGIFIKFQSKPGRRSELISHLVSAGEQYEALRGTEKFIVSLSPQNETDVFVFEQYESMEAKEAHEKNTNYPAIRSKTGEYLDGPPVVNFFFIQGGKGV
jgi:quinol monooxygenase YgiN